MKQFTEDELKRYIESAREIVENKGDCGDIDCSNCPFTDDNGFQTCSITEEITYLAAVGFLAIYDKENE